MKKSHRRFMKKVVITDDGCWRWKGMCAGSPGRPYPLFDYKGERWSARRVAFTLFKPVPLAAHEQARLGCGTPLCVNPDHMRVIQKRYNGLEPFGLMLKRPYVKRPRECRTCGAELKRGTTAFYLHNCIGCMTHETVG